MLVSHSLDDSPAAHDTVGSWAARCNNTWLLIKLMLSGVVFSFSDPFGYKCVHHFFVNVWVAHAKETGPGNLCV